LSYALKELFAELERCDGIPTIADLHRSLSEATLDLADILPHAACHRDGYVRTLIAKTDRFESLVMCWMPGQKSPIHDHGGAACGVRVIQGSVTETLYTLGADGFADAFRRRVFHAGDVLSADNDALHSLGNLVVARRRNRPVALVTLHVYAPELKNSRKFAERPANEPRSPRRPGPRPTIVVVGGGAAGALTAIHLAPAGSSARVVLVERATRVARGIAFGTPSLAHLLNVPAARMSAFDDDPDHFFRWARARLGPELPADSFLPRQFYGDYLAELLDDRCSRTRRYPIERVKATATDVVTDTERPCVRLADGTSIAADFVVLALGHSPPRDPSVREGSAFYQSRRYTRSPWTDGALAAIAPDADVLLLGMGLTMFDVAMDLRWRGHFGRIHALSRHGLMPRRHASEPLRDSGGPPPEYWLSVAPRARVLLRALRSACELADADWRVVVDSLRGLTPRLWAAATERERRRFLSHLRTYWDVHRHRAPSEVEDEIMRFVNEGYLLTHAGRLRAWSEDPGGVTAVLERGEIRASHVVNCTGPESDVRSSSDPLVRALLDRGLIVRDALGLGVVTTEDGALVHAGGAASTRLFTIGTWRRAALWESVAVPELRAQASGLAQLLAREARRVRPSATKAVTPASVHGLSVAPATVLETGA
jgi:uncharacterized NAD(P)/FAD-binding protein YdhS/predicted metal-dependent enzyme (double-stranded beta helix superfamily)